MEAFWFWARKWEEVLGLGEEMGGGSLVLEEDGGCLGLDEKGSSLDSDEAGRLQEGKTGGFAAQ